MMHSEDAFQHGVHACAMASSLVQQATLSNLVLRHICLAFFLPAADLFRAWMSCKSFQEIPIRLLFTSWLLYNEGGRGNQHEDTKSISIEFAAALGVRCFLRDIQDLRGMVVCAGGFPASRYSTSQSFSDWLPGDLDLWVVDHACELNVMSSYCSLLQDLGLEYNIKITYGSYHPHFRANVLNRWVESVQPHRNVSLDASIFRERIRYCNQQLLNISCDHDNNGLVELFGEMDRADFAAELLQTSDHVSLGDVDKDYEIISSARITPRLSISEGAVRSFIPAAIVELNVILIARNTHNIISYETSSFDQGHDSTEATDDSEDAVSIGYHKEIRAREQSQLCDQICGQFDLVHCQVSLVVDADLNFVFHFHNEAFEALKYKLLILSASAFCLSSGPSIALSVDVVDSMIKRNIIRIAKYIRRGYRWPKSQRVHVLDAY